MLESIKEKIHQIKKYQFLFSELVKRDFKKKYKRTVLGMFWSVLSPLMQLAVMAVVFSRFFGSDMEHYIIYLFSGNLIFSFYKDATIGGMHALMQNADIIKNINVPKYLFMISKEVSACINFGLTLVIYFFFVAIDGISFSWNFLLLIYPVVCLVLFNIGVGFILSALFVIFKDVQYLYDIFTQLLMYVSAIFYTTSIYPEKIQLLFFANPVYSYIAYFRSIVIEGTIPPAWHHLLCFGYAVIMLITGMAIYKKYNYKFMYYI
jgi:ABC-2 type transport system permease protein